MQTMMFRVATLCAAGAACLWMARPAPAKQVPLPDLTITAVVEAGATARVRVSNVGMAASAMCRLRVFDGSGGGGWVFIGQQMIPALPAGGSVWVSISAPQIALAPTMYFADGAFQVKESNENNNRVMVP